MINIQEIVSQFHAYQNTSIEVNGKIVYLDLFYHDISLSSFRVKTSCFGECICIGKTIEELENYLNTL